MIDAGATVALATNTNPGSSNTTAIGFCIALAVRDMGTTVDEAVQAATLGAATSLWRNDVGRLAVGARADAIVLLADRLRLPTGGTAGPRNLRRRTTCLTVTERKS